MSILSLQSISLLSSFISSTLTFRQIYCIRKLLSAGKYGKYTFSTVDEKALSSSPIRQISLYKEVSVTSLFSLSGRRETKEELWEKKNSPAIFSASRIYLSPYTVERFSYLNYYDRFLPLLKEERILQNPSYFPPYFPSSVYQFSKYWILPSQKILRRYGRIVAIADDSNFLYQYFHLRSLVLFSLLSDIFSLYLFFPY